MSDHLWIPDAATIEAAQSTALARHLGLETYEQLLAYSVAEPAAFWDAATRWLDLGWETEWTQVLDDANGIAWTTWFVDGRLNLAWSCVGRHVAARGDHLAIVVEHEDLSESTRTFAELWDEVGRLGQVLLQLRQVEGCRRGRNEGHRCRSRLFLRHERNRPNRRRAGKLLSDTASPRNRPH